MITSSLSDVTPQSITQLEFALRGLAQDLGDPYRIDTAALQKTLFGNPPAAFAALGKSACGELTGAALYSPIVSTVLGATGAYVSDLWVAEPARGKKAGQALLAYVAERAGDLWDARFIRLMVYGENEGARKFYEKLGFACLSDDIALTLSGKNLDLLRK